jgi:hypothetical protein
MGAERRRAPRYQLVAEAEIVELRSHAKLSARTSDVSLVGCFMNSARSFPQGTMVRLNLVREEKSFTSLGVIVRAQPTGMAVSFSDLKMDQQSELQRWLTETRKAPS